MYLAWDVSKLKMKCKDRYDPSVNAGGRHCVWVVEHTSYVPGVHFDNKVPNTNKEELVSMKGVEQSIEL